MLNGKEHGKKKEDTGRLVEPSPAAEVSADGNDVPKDAEAGETAEGVAEVELEQPQEPFADSPGSCRGIAIALADAHVPDADQPAATNGSKGAEATGATEAVEAVAAEATEAAGTAEATEATEAVEATEAAEAAEALEDSLAAEAAALQADAASSFAASSPSSASNADFAEPETEGAAERAAESPEQAATAQPEEAETFPTEPTVSTVSDLEKALHRIDEDPAEVQTFQQGAAMVPETWEIAGRDRPPSPDAQMIRLTANDSQELPSETVLLPGESVHEPDLASFFEEVPLMPPASFFDDQELERLTSQAVAEATALLAWLTGAGSSRSLPEQEVFLQQQQARELPIQVAQPPQTGCVDDCLAEALADDPTRGCLPGEYWKPYPPTSPVSSCQPCPAGWYCTGIVYGNFSDYPVNLNRRTPCPPGTFRNVTSGVNLSDCEFCSPGYFSEVEASTACVACPAGTYSITAGSSKVWDCVECPAGHFCLEATGRPTPCAAGSYVSFPGMTNESDCHNCTEGHYCQIGTVWPLECPKGSYGNTTGLRGNGSYPGTFLPDAWTDITPTGVEDTDCIACPAASFCVNGSVVPRQCPPGTFSNASSDSETDCEPCPEGYQCRFPVSSDLDQSSVARLPNGQLVAGSDGPELCPVDANVLHFSFPNVTGCVEHCPYQFPRQSYCHRPGDGRVPDRTSWALVVEQHLSLRSGNRAVEVRQTALLDLILVLQNLTAEEAANTLTMLDGNGRTALHKSAMMNDVEALDVLLQYGGASTLTINAARDADGFTALMQALLLDNTDASSWLVSNGAILTQADASLLNARGLDVAATGTSPEAAVLGRAGLPWTGPSAESFGGLGQVSPMPTTTPWEFSTTTTVSTTTTMTQTSTSTST
ncbi:unnamed protein product [Effrenium voratum]|nr:unnamed protein product [Effrenium voratum]